MDDRLLSMARIEHFLDLAFAPPHLVAERLPHPVLVSELRSEAMHPRTTGWHRSALDTTDLRALWQHVPTLTRHGKHLRSDGMLRFVLPVAKRDGAPSGRISVGRAPTSDIVVPDPRVSKLHAYFHCDDGAFSIADVGSRNRTMLNGRALAPHQLERVVSGDQLRFGSFVAVFLLAAEFGVYLRTLLDTDDVQPGGE